MQQKVIITGGPGTGKSTIINKLIDLGYSCMHEISRSITLDAQEKGIVQLFLKKPLLFSELLLKGRIKQHKEASSYKSNLVFFDRGIPDVQGYMNYLGVTYPRQYSDASINFKYDYIFMMPPWQKIYISDNERYESYEQSLAIHNHLVKTYKKLNYNIIEVPIGTVNQRVDFILNQLEEKNETAS